MYLVDFIMGLILCQGEIDPMVLEAILAHRQQMVAKAGKVKKLTPEQADAKRRRLWISIAKKEIPKVG